jgi:heme-degrading monooxygenase HmoA
MITVAAIVNIRAGQSAEFEAAFQQAAPLIATAPGYLDHELHKCQDTPGRYLVLEHWQSRDAHMLGFRQSPEFQEWKRLTHHFYDPFPTVEHYEPLASYGGNAP